MCNNRPVLKPCPFCGGKPWTANRDIDYNTCNPLPAGTPMKEHWVQCCGTGPEKHTLEAAIEAWNTRTPEHDVEVG